MGSLRRLPWKPTIPGSCIGSTSRHGCSSVSISQSTTCKRLLQSRELHRSVSQSLHPQEVQITHQCWGCKMRASIHRKDRSRQMHRTQGPRQACNPETCIESTPHRGSYAQIDAQAAFKKKLRSIYRPWACSQVRTHAHAHVHTHTHKHALAISLRRPTSSWKFAGVVVSTCTFPGHALESFDERLFIEKNHTR